MGLTLRPSYIKDSEDPMADLETAQDLDAHIAAVRANIRDLTEQAAAYSGAADESRNADRIAEQEELLAQLQKRRALLPE